MSRSDEHRSLADLRRVHRGPVITPEDSGYDPARTTFNGLLDRKPELIARPLDVDDLVAAVSFAGELGLPIAVRGGGHSVAGHGIGDGSLVVDLRLMREVVVDAETRTATCGGGSLWQDLDPPCLRHGLATTGGTVGDTGVGGLTLSGGIGHLMGLHGLTLDNLLGATVVTADGEILVASERENTALFWALRGGGGNFGVVVDFTFRLHPVGLLLGGLLHYRLEDAPAVVIAWRELMADAPDTLVCFPQIFRTVPGEEAAMTISVAQFDGLDAGRELIGPLLETAEPVRDDVRPMHYAELQEIFGRSLFGLRNYWSGRFLHTLPDELIELTCAQFEESTVTGNVLLEPLHGAATRVAPETTAFAGREARYNATYSSVWSDPREDRLQIERARAYSAALAPWTIGGGYLNYASEAAGDSLDTEFGGERFERLRAVKRRYDPENRFRFNHNITPE